MRRPNHRMEVLLGVLAAAGLVAAVAIVRHAVHDPAVPDMADPFILRVDDTYYAFGTEHIERHAEVQVMRSRDLRRWEWLGDALQELPGWAAGATWAPTVLPTDEGFVLYYSAAHGFTGKHCIDRAFSTDPTGKFTAVDDSPLLCDIERGGVIDPSPFVDDDGTAYLLWKSEGRYGGHAVEPDPADDRPTLLWAQQLDAAGTELVGEARLILAPSQPWEGGVVEAPAMVRHGDTYLLLYAGNRWDTADYAIGWASCSSPVGPCTPGGDPVMVSHGDVLGPGAPEIFTDADGALHVAFHAWRGEVGYPESARELHVTALRIEDGRPVLGEGGSEPAVVARRP